MVIMRWRFDLYSVTLEIKSNSTFIIARPSAYNFQPKISCL